MCSTSRQLLLSLFFVLALSGLLALASPGVASAQPKVFVAGSGDLPGVKAYLDASGVLGQVDTFDIPGGTPTLATLQNYDVVMIYSNSPPQNPTLWGDTLVSYVDAGGNVLECMYCLTVSWGPDGTWANYSCITQDDARTNSADGTKGTVYDANHPIIQNVNNLTGGFGRRNTNAVINGATKIMDWNDGNVCLAVNETQNGRIACISMYPAVQGYGWDPNNSDTDLMFAQALVWAALGSKPKIDQPAAGAMTDGYLTQGYSVTITHTGGQDPIAHTISAGSLPPGLTLNSSTGEISGTPTSVGNYSFTVQIEDNVNDTDTRDYTIDVYALPQISSPGSGALADGLINNAYGPVTFTTSGGKPALAWSLASGTLPPGLTQNPGTGAISGTPTVVGNSNFTVRLTDANGKTHDVAYSIAVFDTPVITSPASGALTPEGYLATPYSRTFTAAGGVPGPGYVWIVSGGTLPAGLALNSSTGALTGTPSATGSS
ncbi:MAG: Ig domain-containing protein, partial [Planctomycetota bacterium]